MRRNDKGFTLVELIIVIAVIGVLAAILIPVLSGVLEKANAGSALADAKNAMDQAMLSAAAQRAMPRNIVIFVKKESNWYAYGCNLTKGGRIQISQGNPYKGFDDIAALNDAYGWNQAEEPDPNGTYTFGDNMGFYLVPSANTTTTHFRSIGTRSGDDYVDLVSEYMQGAKIGSDTMVRQGILLQGTYEYDESDDQSSESGDTVPTGSLATAAPASTPTPTPTPTPVPAVTYKVTFTDGYSSGYADGTGGLIETVTVEEGHDAATPENPEREGYSFTGWNGSFTNVTEDRVVYAEWEKNPVYYYGGSYREANGNLNWAAALPTTSGTVPCNILGNVPGSLTLAPVTIAGSSITRTFEATSAETVVDGTRYIRCRETTEWPTNSNIIYISQDGGTVNGVSTQGITYIKSSTNASDYNFASKWIVLVEDVLGGTWIPVGGANSSKPFYGNFDGMNYAVRNLTHNGGTGLSTQFCSTGFIGNIVGTSDAERAEVRNLYLPNVTMTCAGSSYCAVGAVASGAKYANITNCHSSGSVTNGKNKYGCGGILGQTTLNNTPSDGNYITVRNCSSTATLSNSNTNCNYTGGIIGRVYTDTGYPVTIENCWSSSTISSFGCAGGIVGGSTQCAASCLTISDCRSTANITCTKTSSGIGAIGGIVGGYTGTGFCVTVNRCWYNGIISSQYGYCIGGIAGCCSTAAITDCWSAGSYYGAYNSGANYWLCGISGYGSGQTITRCISYASLRQNGQNTTHMHPINPCATSDASIASFFITGRTYKNAASASGGTTFTFTSAYLDAETYRYHGCTDAAEIISCINNGSSGTYPCGAWTSASAWELSGEYPQLVGNPGNPS